HSSQSSFSGIVVHLQPPITYIPQQCFPAYQRVTNSPGSIRLPRKFTQRFFEPLFQGFQQRPSALESDLATFLACLSTDLFLDGIQFRDALQSLLTYRRFVRHHQIVKLPAHVCPATRFLNAPALVNLRESCVGIRLQRASETAQVRLGMYPLVIW